MTVTGTTGLQINRHPSQPERSAILDPDTEPKHWFGLEASLAEAQEAIALIRERLATLSKEPDRP